MEQSADKVLQQLISEYCCREGRASMADRCVFGWVLDDMILIDSGGGGENTDNRNHHLE